MELYLIRHGQSTSNRGDLPRVADPPLTDLGEAQAQRTGRFLQQEGITKLYCSPMRRALKTAQIIGNLLNQPPHVFVGLHEWGGVWEDRGDAGIVQLPGLTRSEMQGMCPDVILPDNVTDKGWWFHPWKDVTAMLHLAHENAVSFIAHLKGDHFDTDERIAAVSHGGSGSSLISAIFGLPPDVDYDRFSQNNTGISKIQITAERTQLRYLNRVDHLPSEAITW